MGKGMGQGCEQKSGTVAPHVSTPEAARDMDVLRAALGESQLTYLGKSYGTYLGATYAELFPDKVGRFVLDGAVDVSLDASSTVLGRVSPGPDATKVSVSPVNVSTPVFLVRETRSGLPAAQSLLVVGSSAPTEPTTPGSPSPPALTQPAPTTPPPGAVTL